MYKLCKTEQSARRQREIEQALLNALMRKNYESVTITELCDDLGMPRKTFYRYFDSKDDTLYALIDGVVKFERMGRDGKKVSVYAAD